MNRKFLSKGSIFLKDETFLATWGLQRFVEKWKPED
jgi:hypothetical protein